MRHCTIGRWAAACAILAAHLPARGARGEDPSGRGALASGQHPIHRWVLLSPREGKPSPNYPYEGSGSYDPYLRLWIHHGGHDGIPQGFHTFTFDLATGDWRQCFPPTSPPGACCVDGANAFDVANRRFVRFPGGSLGHGYQWSRGVHLKESGVWLYDPAADRWTNMRPPPYRAPEKYSRDVVGGLCSGAAYDPSHEIVLSFGGQSAGGSKNALFAYDAYSNTLQQLPSEGPPPERDGMGITYDSRRDALVVFGSQYLTDDRTWIYDMASGRWQAHSLEPHPPAAKVTKDYSTIPRLAYDSIHDVILCVAWLGEEAHETWAFEPERLHWRKLEPEVEPSGSKSRSRNLTFDAAENLFILETSSARTQRPEIWTYRFGAGAADERPAAPTGLGITTRPGGKATLAWQPSASRAVREYRVERAGEDLPWKAQFIEVGRATGATFEDQGLEEGKVYVYRVATVGAAGEIGPPSLRCRTQPRVVSRVVVSVLGGDRVEARWERDPASDVAGYNIYRGAARVRTVEEGSPGPWRDNDPKYAEPLVVEVTDITDWKKLNTSLLEDASFVDAVDLTRKVPESGSYRFAVFAYVVRAVNRLGTESGPSPYALTIPAEPVNVRCREAGETAELRWDPSEQKAIAGYHVYKLEGTWNIVRLTPELLSSTTLRHRAGSGATRYWIVAVDALGQEGQPSSPAWFGHTHAGFFEGEWHQ